jgi:hypothetical protein
MFGAKKKHYSEVSESKKNINSDYYNIFKNELKKMFSDDTIINDNIKSNNNDIKKKIELDDKDIFFINLFSNYVKNK